MIEESETTESALAARLLILQGVIGDGGLSQVVEGGMARLIRVDYVEGHRIVEEIRGPLPIAEHLRDLKRRAREHYRRTESRSAAPGPHPRADPLRSRSSSAPGR